MKVIGIIPFALVLVAVLATPEEDLNTGTRTFTAKLYKELIKSKPNQNVIFSPFTVQTLMSLVASAAANENVAVIQEIKTSLSLPYSERDRQTAFTEALVNLNKADNDFKVFDATKMYFKNGYTVQADYRRTATNVYGAEIETINFGNSGAAAQNINQWVAKKTNNKITNFVDYYSISANTQNLLINTLYLSGKWEKPFKQADNVIKTFHGPNGNKQVTMMTSFKSHEYYEDNDAQYLKLDMVRIDGGAEMVFVLPKQGLSNVEYKVQNLLQPINWYAAKVHFTLPKFSFSNNMQLKPVLETIGVKKLFQWGAELRGLSYPGHGYVKISDVLQKAFIEVNEWGVTAAAASDVIVQVDDPPVEKTFTADRPFLFYITVDDTMVYAGRVMQV